MNEKVMPFALATALALVLGGYYWHDLASDAQARAERAEESAQRVKELEAELAWHRLDSAVQALEPQMEEPKRREALGELKQEIQRLKSSFKYRQLRLGR